ncbi:PriCT-2 domain-containing protein [Thiocystis violascens]|uniref:Putative ATPase n=1 Tax=Thiocystis violascens (strain ATCC 17096 / DSM 198 / 6111) TaxID=765911 RepID=I3YBE5_THIV6|nr:PriCT-2 domain-containing protein [Thiocystis violascens]AFL74313.1 putative ATPase [Thiocystis violascens DSM 198]
MTAAPQTGGAKAPSSKTRANLPPEIRANLAAHMPSTPEAAHETPPLAAYFQELAADGEPSEPLAFETSAKGTPTPHPAKAQRAPRIGEDLERIRDALFCVPPDDRDTWIKMGMAIKSEIGEAGRELWENWSQAADAYNAADARDVWKSFTATGKVKLGTLFHEAKQNGWRDRDPLPPPTPEEIAERKRQADEQARKAAEDLAREQAETARRALSVWTASSPADPNHPYLVRKGIAPTEKLLQIDANEAAILLGYHPQSRGARLQGPLLVAPIQIDGRPHLSSLELIDGDGRKTALTGRGTKTGGYWAAQFLQDDPGDGFALLIAEGVATALSAKAATGRPLIAALSLGNVPKVLQAMRARYPQAPLLLLADLDKKTGKPDPKVASAAKSVGAALAAPDFGPDRPEGATDFNDLHQASGLEPVWRQIEGAISEAKNSTCIQENSSAKKSKNPSDPSGTRVQSLRDSSGTSKDPSGTRVQSLRDSSGTSQKSGESFRGCLTYEPDNGPMRRLIDSQAAAAIAAHLVGRLAWDADAGAWMTWQVTHWEPLLNAAPAEKLIADAVEEGTRPIGYRVAYLAGITTIIQRRGILPAPNWPPNVVPFANGLLNLESGTLTPATPRFALNWVLPWNYDKQADCPAVKAWLLRSVDGQDPETVELLRAWLAALIRGLPLQYFLTLIGRGGSGKGTFQRLAAALVGIRNVAVTDLARLENRPFETALLYGKRLCMVNEAGKYGGTVDVLKAITGGDHIPMERKHVQQSGSFVFRGLVLMATNEPIIATDATSGLERRRLTVRFPYSATPHEKAAWMSKGGEEAVLHAEIPGLIRWLLEMPVDDIRARLASPPQRVAAENLLGMAAGNSVAEWMLENCTPVVDDKIGVQIGSKKPAYGGGYEYSEVRLYPHYLQWCDETGRSHPVAIRKFSDVASDIAEHLGYSVKKSRDATTRATHLIGLRLRQNWEEPYSWITFRRSEPEESEESGGVSGGIEPAYRKDRRS